MFFVVPRMSPPMRKTGTMSSIPPRSPSVVADAADDRQDGEAGDDPQRRDREADRPGPGGMASESGEDPGSEDRAERR